MTWSDPIVDEVRRARDAYAARFNYDPDAIFNDLKEKELLRKKAIAVAAPTAEAGNSVQRPSPNSAVPDNLSSR